jgi:hypothetical protein
MGMNITVMAHANQETEFAPSVKFLSAGPDNEFFNLKIHDAFNVFLKHIQLVQLRDVLTQAIADSPHKCSVEGCELHRDAGGLYCAMHGEDYRVGDDALEVKRYGHIL